jgi:hypothetical protein
MKQQMLAHLPDDLDWPVIMILQPFGSLSSSVGSPAELCLDYRTRRPPFGCHLMLLQQNNLHGCLRLARRPAQRTCVARATACSAAYGSGMCTQSTQLVCAAYAGGCCCNQGVYLRASFAGHLLVPQVELSLGEAGVLFACRNTAVKCQYTSSSKAA